MKKVRKMSEKTCFLTACTFAALSILSSVLLACLHFYDITAGLSGIGGIIAFYAVSAAKLAVLCFLSGVTLFFAVMSVIFSVKTIKDNRGIVRLYGIMLSALSTSAAAFGGVVFILIILYINNYKI